MIRILIADDQELVRTGFRVVLDAEADLEVVGEAADGFAALEAVETLLPDVVLMDIRMPNLDGIEATRRIAAGDGSPRILILTTFDLDDYVYEALRAGASGFLLKDARAEELRQAIRMVAAGDALLSPAITKRVIKQFARAPRAKPPKEFDELTAREHETLRLIADGLSNAEIGQQLYISETTVKTHVTHILQKLGLHDRDQAIVLTHQTGLFEADAPTLRIGDEHPTA